MIYTYTIIYMILDQSRPVVALAKHVAGIQAAVLKRQDGMMECKSCGLGTYANFTGMKSCFQCGADMTFEPDKLAMFTTSQKVSDGDLAWQILSFSQLSYVFYGASCVVSMP